MTGHRPQDFTPTEKSFAQDSLWRLSGFLRERHGMEEIISGMALGADTWWAQAAVARGIPFAAYIPFEDQLIKWRAGDQLIWRQLREQAAREVVVGGQHYSVGALHGRNDAMIRDSDLAIAVWHPSKTVGGTASCVKKLNAKEKPYLLVDLDELRIRRVHM